MKARHVNLIWGLALIAAGIIFMAESMGYLEAVSPLFWIVFFSAVSLLFFTTYFLNGVQNWGWLFPASVFAGLALTIGLAEANLDGGIVAVPIMFSVAAPFLVIYSQDTRGNWWALIPAWTMIVLSAIILLSEVVPGEAIGTLVMFAVALPFAVVFLVDRTRKWALIPAGVLAIVGLIPLLSTALQGESMAAAIMFLFSLPFVVVYFISERNWWALIPAGTFLSLGVMLLVSGSVDPGFEQAGRMVGVLLLGLALTFTALWLRRGVHLTDWAKYPAVGLGIMGVLALALGAEILNLVWPVVIIAVGVIILYNTVRRREP